MLKNCFLRYHSGLELQQGIKIPAWLGPCGYHVNSDASVFMLIPFNKIAAPLRKLYFSAIRTFRHSAESQGAVKSKRRCRLKWQPP